MSSMRCLLLLALACPSALRAPGVAQTPVPAGRALRSAPSVAPSVEAERDANAGLAAEELALAAGVDVERATRRVRELVELGPRMGGTPSGDAAAEYLEQAFAAAGLAVEVVEDPPAWSHAEESWRVELSSPEDAGADGVLESAWPLGFSPAARGEARLALEAEAGVALLAERTPQWLHRRVALPAGAPALVLIDGQTTEDGRAGALGDLRRDAPCPAFVLSRADGQRLRARLAEDPRARVRFELRTRVARTRPRTVVARLPGRTEGGGFFLVCAHGDSDSGGPGANDNGSGEAIVLEMAAAWSSAIAAGSARPPAREVRFAIWGTEIHSSRAFLARVREADEELLGVLNFDQSGFGQAGDRLHVEPDDLAANVPFVRAVLGVLADARGRESEDFPARWVTNGSLGGTDSYVFSAAEEFRANTLPSVTLYASAWDRPREVERTAGMPGESWNDGDAVHVDFDPWYHSAGDTPANTTDRQPWHLGWGARVGLIAVRRYLDGLP